MTYTLTPTNDYDGNCLLEGPGIRLWLTDFSQEVIDRLNAQAAEIERLQEEVAFWRDRMRIVSPKMDGQHAWRLANEWPPLVGPNADAAVRHALDAIRTQSLPAPPAKEE